MFDKYETDIANTSYDKLSAEDFDIIKKLALIAIDERNGASFLDIGAEKLQKLITNLVLYFINDIELKDTTEIKLKKRITNNMPYIEVTNKKTGYETIYDVNEMFTLLKAEMGDKNTYKNKIDKSLLKQLKVNTDFTVEQIPTNPVPPTPTP
jgi:hypothetical protein